MSQEDLIHFGTFLDRKVECSNTDELIGLINEAVSNLNAIHYEFKALAARYDESDPQRAAAIQVLFERYHKKLFFKYNGLLAKAKEFSRDNEIITCAAALEGDGVLAFLQALKDGVLFTEVVTMRLERLKAVLQGDKKITSVDKDSGRCFIATATMGDFDDPVVVALREFRDDCLQQSMPGRTCVALYYRFSPALARLIENSSLLKWFSFWLIVRPAHAFARLWRRNTQS